MHFRGKSCAKYNDKKIIEKFFSLFFCYFSTIFIENINNMWSIKDLRSICFSNIQLRMQCTVQFEKNQKDYQNKNFPKFKKINPILLHIIGF